MSTLHEKYIVDSHGEKSAELLPIDEYEELLEDIHDLTVIAERKGDSNITMDEMKDRLKK